jgi:hypothetical protein
MSQKKVFLLTDAERVFLDHLRVESLRLVDGPATRWLQENAIPLKCSYPLDKIRYDECVLQGIPLYEDIQTPFQLPSSPEEFLFRSRCAAAFLSIQDVDFIRSGFEEKT